MEDKTLIRKPSKLSKDTDSPGQRRFDHTLFDDLVEASEQQSLTDIFNLVDYYRTTQIPGFTRDSEFFNKLYNNVMNCTDEYKIVEGMLLQTDITIKMLYAMRYAELVAKKVTTPLNNKINQLKQEYNNVVIKEEQTNILWNSAIQNEARANTELSKCKKKHDKEIRVLEHKIADLEKELERLKNK